MYHLDHCGPGEGDYSLAALFSDSRSWGSSAWCNRTRWTAVTSVRRRIAVAIVLDFIRDSIHQQHEAWDQAMSDLTPDQMHFRPNGQGNHIGFIAWHYVRTEDNLVQFVFQNRKPTVWLEGGYDQKFGLPRTAQGTGMPPEEAARMRLPSVEQWMAYQRAVWQATDAWLNSVTE